MKIAPQVAAPQAQHATSVTLDARAYALHPDQVLQQLSNLDEDPASVLMRQSARDLMSLAGVASVHWGKNEPGQLTLTFANENFQRLADNVLRDTVNGVKLVLGAQVPGPPPSDADWWTGSSSQMFAAVRAMPGVVDSSSSQEHGLSEVMFRTSDVATSSRLKALVNESLAGKWRVLWLPFPPKS